MTAEVSGSKHERLVRYLQAIVSMRQRPVPSLDQYESVLWFGNVPDTDECYSRHREEELEEDPDIWLQVSKPTEPVVPPLPESCFGWIDDESLQNSESEPELLTSRVEKTQVASIGEDDEEIFEEQISTHLLEEHPEVTKAFEAYMENLWRPWQIEHQIWRETQAVFSRLFEIRQVLLARGEQLELVLGFGLLTWRSSSGSVKRHLMTGKVSLDFDSDRASFELRPDPTGFEMRPETDMLSGDDLPFGFEEAARERFSPLEDDPWSEDAIQALKSTAIALTDRSVFIPSDTPAEDNATEIARVEWAPALILRKRSERSVQSFLKRLEGQDGLDEDVPDGWRDLCESLESDLDCDDDSESSFQDADEYLPLATNEEQRQILRALNHRIGALVQGPPGTGKSHTIANLICHLLANGKRVLITAHTPRALQVLSAKLPDEIRPLAVSVLGSGVEDQRSLEYSVRGITDRHGNESPATLRRRAANTKQKREDALSDIAKFRHKIREIREADIRTHNCFGYSGSTEQIALALASNEARYSWLVDDYGHNRDFEIDAESIQAALRTLSALSSEEKDRLALTRPSVERELCPPGEFKGLVEAERQAKNARQAANDVGGRQLELSRPNVGKVAAAYDDLDRLESAISDLESRGFKWTQPAVAECLARRDRPWSELSKATAELLEAVQSLSAELGDVGVELQPAAHLRRIRSLASDLRTFLDQGGNVRLRLLKPKPIRDAITELSTVLVDGSPALTKDRLGQVVVYADLVLRLDELAGLWAGKHEVSSGPVRIRLQHFAELQEAVDQVLTVYELSIQAAARLEDVRGITAPNWTDHHSRKTVRESLASYLASVGLKNARKRLDDLCEKIQLFDKRPNADHGILGALQTAVDDRDIVAYTQQWEQVGALNKAATDYQDAQRAIDRLAIELPKLAAAIKAEPSKEEWQERVASLPAAVAWKQARSWLDDVLTGASLSAMRRAFSDAEKNALKLLASEASDLAWSECFDRMQDSHRRALISWQQKIKLIGRGTGKYAATHRRAAQRYLKKSLPAIPAWIMPLHRVFESVEPIAGAFDVAIIDEASQCGPDSLLLFFLAKKVLIVGDDKQISPANVGARRDEVNRYINEMLPDFEHKDSFILEQSLFAHGEMRIGNRIVLREHFRCMPEIIRFSNDLAYTETPLIPLRQYPPDRLDPLRAVHVPGGVRSGAGRGSLNKPEAEALVHQIKACCKDPKYGTGKKKLSFGVISLLGPQQAEFISQLLLQEIGADEYTARNIVCGDASSFQGDERDVIFLSMVAAAGVRQTALTAQTYIQRFNVAASRARDQMWLFHSVLPEDLSQQCVRRRLLEHFLDPARSAKEIAGIEVGDLESSALRANRQIESPPDPFDSWFEVDVALAIARRGFKVVPQFEIAGYRIDLMIEGSQSRLAVECDGDRWHGPEQYDQDVDRQRKLEYAGLQFVRIRGCEFFVDADTAMQPVWKALSALGIRSAFDLEVETSRDRKPFLANHSEEDPDDDSGEDLVESEATHTDSDNETPSDAGGDLFSDVSSEAEGDGQNESEVADKVNASDPDEVDGESDTGSLFRSPPTPALAPKINPKSKPKSKHKQQPPALQRQIATSHRPIWHMPDADPETDEFVNAWTSSTVGFHPSERTCALVTSQKGLLQGSWHRTRRTLRLAPSVTADFILLRPVEVAPGGFQMGSMLSEEGRDTDESPRRVRLTHEYWLQVTPVTQAQWSSIIGGNPSTFHIGDDHPVETINYSDCFRFIRRLMKKTGLVARLPTEAEWEFACRAGSTGSYSFDGEITRHKANFDTDFLDEADSGHQSSRTTSPVTQYEPNPWGFHDMHGNVWEWCHDWYGPYVGDSEDDPCGPPTGQHRVIRGGSWNAGPWELRSASRNWESPEGRFKDIGFRLCLDFLPVSLLVAPK